MTAREITPDDLANLKFVTTDDGARRIVADLTCTRCGAFQAVDSDPSPDPSTMPRLAARLMNQAGWRANDDGNALCPNCARVCARVKVGVTLVTVVGACITKGYLHLPVCRLVL